MFDFRFDRTRADGFILRNRRTSVEDFNGLISIVLVEFSAVKAIYLISLVVYLERTCYSIIPVDIRYRHII